MSGSGPRSPQELVVCDEPSTILAPVPSTIWAVSGVSGIGI